MANSTKDGGVFIFTLYSSNKNKTSETITLLKLIHETNKGHISIMSTEVWLELFLWHHFFCNGLTNCQHLNKTLDVNVHSFAFLFADMFWKFGENLLCIWKVTGLSTAFLWAGCHLPVPHQESIPYKHVEKHGWNQRTYTTWWEVFM